MRARVADGTEHDHTSAVVKFGVSNDAVGARVDGVAGEAERALQPLDRGVGVAVARAGNQGEPPDLTADG